MIAPSLIPRKPGEQIKTDRRDARKLAELLAGGLLTEVHPPSPEDEAVRDLSRAREDAKQDLTRARHRLSKFLLRHGLGFGRGRKAWTQAHAKWLRGLRLEHAAEQAVLDDYCLAIDQLEERLRALEARLASGPCLRSTRPKPHRWTGGARLGGHAASLCAAERKLPDARR